jgi:F-box interacting protein
LVEPYGCREKNLSLVLIWSAARHRKLCLGVFSVPPEGVKNREQFFFFFFFLVFFLLGGTCYTHSFFEKRQKEKKMEFSRRKMLILPQELIAEILSLLPAESLVRFQCVSKAWFSIINDPYFINMHLHTNRQRILIGKKFSKSAANRWPEEYYLVNISNEDRLGDPVKIFLPFLPFYRPGNLDLTIVRGFCNGLVCVLFVCGNRKYGPEIVIWNPSIRKYKKVPFEPSCVDVMYKLGVQCNLAFGYDSVNNDYKVLRIVKFIDPKSKTKSLEEVMVYSLKAQSWRRVEDQLPYKEEPFLMSSPELIFTNGAFHWLVTSATETILLAFDLTIEKFRVLQTLPFKSTYNLKVLEGLLCVFAYVQPRDTDVWIMKEYGVTSSWSRLCTVPTTFRYYQSLAFSKDGKKVLMKGKSHELVWYDIKKKTCTINVDHISIKCNWTATCVGSLFLLDGDSYN